MRFLLCPACRHAWTEPARPLSARACDCDEVPIVCSPWSNDSRSWYQARVSHKARAIYGVLTSDQRAKRMSLNKGIAARGNTVVRGRAAV